jgi:hypothetical protein
VGILLNAFVATAMLATSLGGAAAADLVKGRRTLPELVLGTEGDTPCAVSEKEIEMEAGRFYRLAITAKDSLEYKFFATEFFRNIWIDEIIIEHPEVHMTGAPHHLEFDEPGTINIHFVPVHAGEYTWSVQGFEDKGMTGKFIVK